MPVVGFLHAGSSGKTARATAVFLSALNEAGFAVGANIVIEYRWAENQYDQLPALAADLVRRPVSVLVAQGGSTSALAAKAATSTIPIVFSGGGDPVAQGLVASMNRPGGNATGVRVLDAATEGKRLGLLRELVPNAGLIGVLLNGLVLLNVNSYIQQIIIGVIIVLAVAFDTFAKSRRRAA